MHWTDSQVDLLISLWTEGKTPAQIAARLAGLGRDSVLEKIQLLRLGRPARGPMSSQPRRTLKPGLISAGQHSHRFRSVLAEQARRRVEHRAGEDVSSPALRDSAERIDNRQAGLLAALLALEEENLPARRSDASAIIVQRLRGWSSSPAYTSG